MTRFQPFCSLLDPVGALKEPFSGMTSQWDPFYSRRMHARLDNANAKNIFCNLINL